MHKIDRSLLEAVWLHAETRTVTKQGMVLAVDGTKTGAWQMIKMPELPNLAEGGRFRIDFWMKLRELSPGHTPCLQPLSVEVGDCWQLACGPVSLTMKRCLFTK